MQLFSLVGLLCILVMAFMMYAATSMNMVSRNLSQSVKFAITLYPVAITADKVPDAGVDTRDYDSAAFLVMTGAIAAAGLVLPVAVESEDNATWTDVVAADLQGAFVNAAANTDYKVGYKGKMRYIAIRADYISGTSIVMGAAVVEGDAHYKPVA